MTQRNEAARDARAIAADFHRYYVALRRGGIRARGAAFAALCLAAGRATLPETEAAGRIRAMARELRARRDIRSGGAGALREMAAAALIASGRDADALARAQADLRAAGLPRSHEALLPAGLAAAAAASGFDAAAQRRLASIRSEYPRVWWRKPELGDAQAVSLALQGLDGGEVRQRQALATQGLENAGLVPRKARRAALAAAAFDPNPVGVSRNFTALMDGRAGDRRLRGLKNSDRAALSAAAGDPDLLHAALAPMLDAAQELGRGPGRQTRAIVAKGLAMSALGGNDPRAAMSDLFAIIAAETAAIIAAAAAAGAAAGS